MEYLLILTTRAGAGVAFTGPDINDLCEILHLEITGPETGEGLREELRGQPIIKGLHGPMWDGLNDRHQPIIRYEDQAEYDRNSK